jgi:hypothetical protein
MRFIGIDPGVQGGIAVLGDEGEIIAVARMPDSHAGILQFFKLHAIGARRAGLEYVRSSPQMGVASSFTFGRGYGALEMALTAANIPYYDIHPARWQRALGCLSKGDKNATKRAAAARWPSQKITHANADCLLIAEWCRRSTLGPTLTKGF